MPGTNFWRCLEDIRGQTAVPAVWRSHLAEEFDCIRQSFLRSCPEQAESVPCGRCGCRHEVVHQAGSIVGICHCESWNCDDLMLQAADVTVWELHWGKLARALCQALALERRFVEMGGMPGTVQIGSWSGDAVPVMLSICTEAGEFRTAVTELVGRLGRPFILLAPTGAHLEVRAQEILAHCGAAVFPLEGCCRLSDGRIEPVRAPGGLFADFAPAPMPDPDEELARRAVALVQKMENARQSKPPGLATVFRFYCLESLSAGEIAKKCHCSKATVMDRLKQLRQRLGMDPVTLRRVSGHLARLNEQATDPRARRIRRSALIDDAAREE